MVIDVHVHYRSDFCAHCALDQQARWASLRLRQR